MFAIAKITIIVAIMAAAFLAFATALNTLDINTVPEELRGFVGYVQIFFNSGGVAMGVAWLRALFGYYENYARAQAAGQQDFAYEINKTYKTMAYYLGGIAIVFEVTPSMELRAIGTAIIFFLDLLASAIARILNPPQAATTTVSSTGVPGPPTQ